MSDCLKQLTSLGLDTELRKAKEKKLQKDDFESSSSAHPTSLMASPRGRSGAQVSFAHVNSLQARGAFAILSGMFVRENPLNLYEVINQNHLSRGYWVPYLFSGSERLWDGLSCALSTESSRPVNWWWVERGRGWILCQQSFICCYKGRKGGFAGLKSCLETYNINISNAKSYAKPFGKEVQTLLSIILLHKACTHNMNLQTILQAIRFTSDILM